jgi:phosphopantothenoylcysteine decarboxylase/phosphopantothenate--cysteine ligase
VEAADAPMNSGAAAGREGGRRPWNGRRVLLGVTGGIAAYKTIQLARDLTQLGATVDVVLTHSARAFVGELSYEALTGRPVLHNILAPGGALDHIRLAREADVVCIAPATADFIARIAQGRSDELLSAVLLATRAPVLVCPAMNDRMWSHDATQQNTRTLQTRGYEIVGPATGPLAFGEGVGPGRMADPNHIIEHIGRTLARDERTRGRKVLITAGPTREPVDPVRVLTNRSSGRMGFAIASAAWRRGFDVQLISGPVEITRPHDVAYTSIETAQQMYEAVATALPDADALIMAAAIADFRPAAPADHKIKKTGGAPDAIALEAATDVLYATRSLRKPGAVVIGFALETQNLLQNATKKMQEKDLDLIVANDATEKGAGFETSTNRVTLLARDGSHEDVPLQSKDDVAEIVVDRLITLLEAKSNK